MKLKDGEAAHLAALLIATCRTSDLKKQIEIEAWVKRLQGGRSALGEECMDAIARLGPARVLR